MEGEDPMQLGRARLTQEERQRRQLEGRCFYCGEQGHLVATCPIKRPIGVSLQTTSTPIKRTLIRIQVKNHTVTNIGALIDSGADESLMDWSLAAELGIKSEPLARPIRAKALDGKELFVITHVTELIRINIKDHEEKIRLYLFKAASHTLILGLPWLFQHNPQIDWRTGEIKAWGKDCIDCFMGATHKKSVAQLNLFSANPTTESEYPDLKSVPPCYHQLREAFSKTKAMSLPPHRPYDCAIDLISGSNIPKGRLYSVSGPERTAMKEYLTASLKAGLIRPSSSPAGAGFFFVGKKDGSLRPCIDYSPLNDITIKKTVPSSSHDISI
ncbi:uncharacterized protein KIAA0040 homolog isoform X2 [Nerophis lumbriciformis]